MLFMERQMYDDHESEEDTSDEEGTDANRKTNSGNLRGNQIKYEDFFRGDMIVKRPFPSSSSSKKKGNGSSKKGNVMSKKNDADDDDEEGSHFDGGDNSDVDFDKNGEDDYDFGDDDDNDEGDDDDGDDDDDEDNAGERESKMAKPVKQRALTTHEKREQRMAVQIAQIESKTTLRVQFMVFVCVLVLVC